MRSIVRIASIVAVVFTIGMTATFAQKVKPKAPVSNTADYVIADLKVMAYSSSTGKLEDTNPAEGEPMSFFNDLDTSLFVWVFVQGEKGTFEAGRMANVVVTEGKKVVASRNVQIGIPNEDGFYIVPVFVYGPLCDQVKITAKLTGQKTASPKTVSIPFMCGE
ncbi:MAG: hypothetical protein KA956_02070 [Pyrinomonadaceae bacterium]|nr:hypothetical protein [Acidobacteriota bacterium]MBK7934216.1 hypothetical protein [Acidobacteriota bacterium]MBP7375243.1 hypothetical protein [Pyrinomonadaceae bacterium]